MQFIKRLILSYWPLFFLLFLEIFLFLRNWLSVTYFLGWDNLFPELNFFENIKRSIFGVWLEYRGLGLLDGMSFAANLPHNIFSFVLSLVLPKHLLRYFFLFLMHFLGGLGVFLLLKEIFNNKQGNRNTSSLFGSLFYLLNIGTVQIFYAPYEVFAVHFAFLPLLLLFTARFLKKGTRPDLALLGVISLLSVSQAHVPTLFLVYLIALSTVVFFYLYEVGRIGIKRALIVLSLTFITNSFWALPYAHSVIHNTATIAGSKINQMATEDIFLRNKEFGDLKSTALIKGFSLNYVDVQAPGENGFMMDIWREHTKKPIFVIIGISFFALALLGIILILIRKDRKLYPYIVLFLFSFLTLGNDIPILGVLSAFLYTYIPYFFQAFRFTFTKFSILYSLSFSVLFVVGLSAVLDSIGRIKHLKRIFLAGSLFVFAYYSLPSFQGQFLYKNLRLKVPQDYFDLVSYFEKKDPHQRIALLPQPSFWGWTYTGWGYKGSGFIWYGLPQASLDGAFYPWSRENENYYWEISYALYSQNDQAFEAVFDKYQINWILVDESVLNPPSPKALYFDELYKLISSSDKFTLLKEFGKIKVFEVKLNKNVKDFVYLTDSLTRVEPSYKWGNYDVAYLENGDYISNPPAGGQKAKSQKQKASFYYPFRTLFTGKSQSDLEFEVEETENFFIFKKKIPQDFARFTLRVNDSTRELVWVDKESLDTFRVFKPEVKTADSTIFVYIPKTRGYFSADIDPVKVESVQNAKNCSQFTSGEATNEIVEGKYLRLSAVDATNCSASFWLPNLPHELSYLITVESRNLEGKSLLFWLENLNIRKADIETYLEQKAKSKKQKASFTTSYFIQPPMEAFGVGYNLHFDNISIGRERSINDLSKIKVYPFPYKFLTSLALVSSGSEAPEGSDLPFKVFHPNPSYYGVTVEGQVINNQQLTINNPVLVLSQAHQSGWKAYKVKSRLAEIFPFVFGEKLGREVLVNNWSNGWELAPGFEGKIVIFYWPQILEYLGFLGAILTFSYLGFKLKRWRAK